MKEDYWANQVEIQRQEVFAWLAFAQGDRHAAVAGMRAAAEMEDRTEKNVITPGPLHRRVNCWGRCCSHPSSPQKHSGSLKQRSPRSPIAFARYMEQPRRQSKPAIGKWRMTYFQKLLKVAEHADKPGRRELAEAPRDTTRMTAIQDHADENDAAIGAWPLTLDRAMTRNRRRETCLNSVAISMAMMASRSGSHGSQSAVPPGTDLALLSGRRSRFRGVVC
jgi:hypothetical protein